MTADKLDNENISNEEKKNIINDSLKMQPNNPSIHQQNIVINNDSDESQKEGLIMLLNIVRMILK